MKVLSEAKKALRTIRDWSGDTELSYDHAIENLRQCNRIAKAALNNIHVFTKGMNQDENQKARIEAGKQGVWYGRIKPSTVRHIVEPGRMVKEGGNETNTKPNQRD